MELFAEIIFREENTLELKLDVLAAALKLCKTELGYEMLLDISSLDHFGDDPRFEVVYELATLDNSRHLRLRAKVSEDEEVPTAKELWQAAEWHEREIWDMMGIRFTGSCRAQTNFNVGGLSIFSSEERFSLGGKTNGYARCRLDRSGPSRRWAFRNCTWRGHDRRTGTTCEATGVNEAETRCFDFLQQKKFER